MNQNETEVIIQVQQIGSKNFEPYYFCNFNVKKYDIVNIPIGKKIYKAIVIRIVKNKYSFLENNKFKIRNAESSELFFTSLQKKLINFISKYYLCNIGLTSKNFKPNIKNDKSKNENLESDSILNKLSKQQETILNKIQQHNISLIFGVTGSGKSEIYMHIISKTLKENKQALFLIPEISLTPQMEKRLKNTFPNMVEIWHSKINNKYKESVIKKFADKKIKIIAGARSALFLPFENLGLIIVDEEHDDSYKSNSHPKYNARDLAIFLSKEIKVILGSATPSVKSYYLAKKNNYLFNLDSKFFNTKTKLTFNKSNNISLNLISKINQVLNEDKQIIVFTPTKANFKMLMCNNCGNSFKCVNCSINLSVHSKLNKLICHYCDFKTNIPTTCDKCLSDNLKGRRFGTEEVKNELEKILSTEFEQKRLKKKINIKILDSNSVNTFEKLNDILGSFEAKKIDILIGTHMVAKGHDYHNVSLSVILGIDYLLNMQDYRAYEKTFSIFFQIAGRSGRKEDGDVFVETLNVDFFKSISRNYELVLENEIFMRKDSYPPFKKLALVKINHSKEEISKKISEDFYLILNNIKKNYNEKYEVLNVCQSPIFKLKNKFYHQILLKSEKQMVLQNVLNIAICKINQRFFNNIDIDIDPINI